jgi:hypothetical protein
MQVIIKEDISILLQQNSFLKNTLLHLRHKKDIIKIHSSASCHKELSWQREVMKCPELINFFTFISIKPLSNPVT